MVRKLNKRQLAYCYWRARDDTQEAAMQKAGFQARGASARAVASRLETNANVKARIEYERVNIFDKSMVTVEYVLENLKKLAETARYESDRIRATELLGKHLAMFTDVRQDKGVPKSVIIAYGNKEISQSNRVKSLQGNELEK